MTIVLVIVILIAGCIALRIGLRGRRIDDHPLCRRCGFDLTGKPLDSHVCAECGADLIGRNSVQIGHRQRLRSWMLGGVILLLIALIVGGFEITDRSRAIEWIQYLPVKWLLHQAQGNDATARSDALRELLVRAKYRRLNYVQNAATLAVALTIQADATKPWDPLWGDIIELERSTGQVTESQCTQYARQALHDAIRLRVRPTIRLGDPMPYWIDEQSGRVATASVLTWSADWKRIDVSGIPLTISGGWMTWSARPFRGGSSSGSSITPDRFPTDLAPGVHTIDFVFAAQVSDRLTSPAAPGVTIGGSPAQMPMSGIAQTVDLEASVTVLPATRPTVKGVPNPAVARAIQSALSMRLIAAEPEFRNTKAWPRSARRRCRSRSTSTFW